MDIIVCIKQVPDVAEVRWDPVTGTLIREGIPSIINPNDKNALEAGLRLKETHGGKVVILSMGPRQVEDALREGLAMGADEAIQLTSKDFAGSDTRATAYALGLAVKKIGRYDLILCGKEALDGMTAQVGPQLAEFLNIPQLTYAIHVSVSNSKITITQKLGKLLRDLEANMPALVTVEREINQPRPAPIDCIIDACTKDITVWGPGDLKGDISQFGLRGSATRLRKVHAPKLIKSKVRMLEGNNDEMAKKFVELLKEKGVI